MLVSIIIYSYNSADTLDGAVYSALSQHFSSEEYEVLLVDDGSTDETMELTAAYWKRHGNFRYVRLPLSIGKAAACEQALQTARGKYFTSLDSDDALHPLMLAKCVAPLEQGMAELTYCDYYDVTMTDGSHKQVRLDRCDDLGMIGAAAMLRMDAFRDLARQVGPGESGHDVYQRHVEQSELRSHRVPHPLYYRCRQEPKAYVAEGLAVPEPLVSDSVSDGAILEPEPWQSSAHVLNV